MPVEFTESVCRNVPINGQFDWLNAQIVDHRLGTNLKGRHTASIHKIRKKICQCPCLEITSTMLDFAMCQNNHNGHCRWMY